MLYPRILITGANGLVGQALVTHLSRFPDYDVLATGRDAAPRFPGGSCGYVPLDVTRPEEVRRIFMDFTPSVVVNCAAMTQADLCETQRSACWEVNVEAVDHLARLCDQHGSRLVQLSTDFVFDGADGPYREHQRPNPVNFYGKSKLAAENVVRGMATESWAIARTVLVFGHAPNLSRSNLVLWVLDRLSRNETIRVVDDQWRTPTYAPDLAAGLERLIRFGKHGIFHLSGREFLSVYDMACLVAETFDLDGSLIEPTDRDAFQENAERPLRTGFVILKAETELGYRPRSLREALHHLPSRLNSPVRTP